MKFFIWAVLTVLGLGYPLLLRAGHDYVLIETYIEGSDPFKGKKTSQKIFWVKEKSDNWAGTTDLTIWKGKKISLQGSGEYSFKRDNNGLRVTGEAISGLGIGPRINYTFLFVGKQKKARVMGCHDGYPSYKIWFNGKLIYYHKHKPTNLIKLFGNCDIKVDRPFTFPSLH